MGGEEGTIRGRNDCGACLSLTKHHWQHTPGYVMICSHVRLQRWSRLSKIESHNLVALSPRYRDMERKELQRRLGQAKAAEASSVSE